MLDVRVLRSIAEIGPAAWEHCFVNRLESYDYLLAVEQAGIEDFEWRYVIAEAAGDVVAAAPAFLSEYALDTTLTGAGKRLVAGVRRVLPGALTLRLGCIGSPCTETVSLGFGNSVAPDERPRLLRALLHGFEQHALDAGCGLLAIKDTPSDTRPLWDQATRGLGYRSVPGLPVAHLDIDFDTIDDYLARLSPGTRKDMRRKLRSFDDVRIEFRTDIHGIVDAVLDLYRDTRARAAMQFEEMTPAYFINVLSRMRGRAVCALYYVGGNLLAANLLLQDAETLLDKFFCMDGAAGRGYNLYFLSWFTNIRLCLERGLKRYQSGQAAYANKLRLGSTLTSTAMYFRHRNAIVSGALHLAAPLFVSDPAFGATA